MTKVPAITESNRDRTLASVDPDFPGPAEPAPVSFEEKSTWITLIALLVVFTGYFLIAAQMLSTGVTSVVPFVAVLAVAVVLLVTILAVGHAIAANSNRNAALEGLDEHDHLIAWRAEHHSSWILGVGVIGAIFALATPVSTAWVANGLLASLFLSEILRLTLQLRYYRRGL